MDTCKRLNSGEEVAKPKCKKKKTQTNSLLLRQRKARAKGKKATEKNEIKFLSRISIFNEWQREKKNTNSHSYTNIHT